MRGNGFSTNCLRSAADNTFDVAVAFELSEHELFDAGWFVEEPLCDAVGFESIGGGMQSFGLPSAFHRFASLRLAAVGYRWRRSRLVNSPPGGPTSALDALGKHPVGFESDDIGMISH